MVHDIVYLPSLDEFSFPLRPKPEKSEVTERGISHVVMNDLMLLVVWCFNVLVCVVCVFLLSSESCVFNVVAYC